MIIQVVCNGLFLLNLPSDFGFFQERASFLKESVKSTTANGTCFANFECVKFSNVFFQ